MYCDISIDRIVQSTQKQREKNIHVEIFMCLRRHSINKMSLIYRDIVNITTELSVQSMTIQHP